MKQSHQMRWPKKGANLINFGIGWNIKNQRQKELHISTAAWLKQVFPMMVWINNSETTLHYTGFKQLSKFMVDNGS